MSLAVLTDSTTAHASPVSGEIVEVNQTVVDQPALINTDPYDKGWFYKIKLSQPDELAKLSGAADYSKQIGQ